jgi:hypothetical protein
MTAGRALRVPYVYEWMADDYVVMMPNGFHTILVIDNDNDGGRADDGGTRNANMW